MSDRLILRPYQKTVLRESMPRPYAGFFLEMRLGKTLVTIRRVKLLSQRHAMIVFMPFSAFPGWREDLTTEGEDFIEMTGTAPQRRKKWEEFTARVGAGERLWVLCNTAGWRTGKRGVDRKGNPGMIWTPIPELLSTPWDAVILDESPFIKDPTTKTSQFFVNNFRRARFRAVLCGTPAPETPMDYYQQIKFLDHSLWAERNFYEFRAKHFFASGFGWKVSQTGERYIQYVLGRCAFFLQRCDVKLGGIKIREICAVEMPGDIRKLYRQAEDEFMIEADGKEFKTIYAMEKYTWLRRLTSGFLPCEKGKEPPLASKFKLDVLMELILGPLKGQSVVIWATYVAELKSIVPYLNKFGLRCGLVYGGIPPEERDRIRLDFQSGKLKYLAVQPECWKYGTKLTAADTLIYFSSPVGALSRQQSEDRAIDVGTNDSTLLIDMVVTDTIDEDIQMSHIRKESAAESIRSTMKRIQKRRGFGV